MPSPTDQLALAELVRAATAPIAVEVTEAFLERHPDWRSRYGARAMASGVQDAGYHLGFLAASIESGSPQSYASYSRWAARVLAARDIAPAFLAENLEQIRLALGARLPGAHAAAIDAYFEAARDALHGARGDGAAAALGLAAEVFLQAILDGQRHAAVQIAREALREGTPLPELYVDVFQPALYEVGARWEANRLTVAQEHMATAITQYVMAQIYEAPTRTGPARGRLLLTGVEGELHSIGAVMVSDLLETAGWEVRFLGTNLPAASILSAVRDWAPSHVGISTTMLFNVNAVRHLVSALRQEFADRITVVLGGAAFRAEPALCDQVGGDAFAPDLRAVQALLADPR